MLERRPLWGLILLLNVCVVIWRMQEPAMLKVEFVGGVAESANANSNAQQLLDSQSSTQIQQPALPSRPKNIVGKNLLEHQQLYAGKDLLAESAETIELSAKVTGKADDSSHNSGHSSSSRDTRSSRSKKLFNKRASILSAIPIKSTPSQVVTAATLKNAADVRTTTAATERPYNLPPNDFHQLIDLHDFTYIINQTGCSADIQVLILVHSAPRNTGKRGLIRKTWANTDALPRVNGLMPLRVIFLLGAVDTEAAQLDIERENFENGDIVQGSFTDDYRNMTYKHVMALKWFLYNCAQAQLLFKVDDDVFVNTPQLLIFLQRTLLSEAIEMGGSPPVTAAAVMPIQDTAGKYSKSHDNSSTESSVQNVADFDADINATLNYNATHFNASQMLFRHPHTLLFCEFTIKATVKRTFRSKWRATKREYSGRHYPPYCPGYAIIYSPDVVLRLYSAAQLSTYFWIDDVHITGILAQNMSIDITSGHEHILYRVDCEKLLNGVVNSDDVEFLYAWHLISPDQMEKLWSMYLEKANRHFFAAALAEQFSPTLSIWHAARQPPYNTTEFNKLKGYR